MYYIFTENDKTVLVHHGILGQKWGKRNGPPYPLDYRSHSKEEKDKNPKSRISSGEESSEYKKHQPPKKSASSSRSKKESVRSANSNDDFTRKILKKNPNAAVVNPSLLDWAKAHKKEIAIGVGVAAAVAIGAILVSKYGRAAVPPVKTPQTPPSIKIPFEKVKGDANGFKSNEHRFLAYWFTKDAHRFDPITEAEFLSMPNDKIVLSPGAKMFRVSKGLHYDVRDGIEYVSFKPEDRDRYLGFLPHMWRGNGGTSKRLFYEMELAASSKIIAPGKKESIEILEAAIKELRPKMSKAEIHKIVLRDFYQYQVALADRGSQISDEYFAEAARRGYNAVVDWNDAGRLADAPLILLNAKKSARVQDVKKYTLKEVRLVLSQIKLPSSAKPDFSFDDFISDPSASMYELLFSKYLK